MMQNERITQGHKRKRVESGSLLGPDGFNTAKTVSKSRVTAPSFQSAFVTPQRQVFHEANRPRHTDTESPDVLSDPKSSRAARTSLPQFVLDPQLQPGHLDENSEYTSPLPAKASLKPKSLVKAVPVAKSNARTLARPTLKFPVSDTPTTPLRKDSAVKDLSKPQSRFKLPVLPTRPETPVLKTPLKPLLPPRLPPSKPLVAQKALLSHLPLKSSTPPPKPLRTITTTRVARATDISTENGTAELASMVLQDDSEPMDIDDLELKSGIDLSPQKSHAPGRGPKYVRNGLAAHAAAVYSHANTSISLWAKEYSALAKFPKADLRLCVIKILSRPMQGVSSPTGLAICQSHNGQAVSAFAAQDTRMRSAAEFPLLEPEDSPLFVVLFSFAERSFSSSTPIRNAVDFEEETEFWIWKPWRTVRLSASQVHSISSSLGRLSTSEKMPKGLDARLTSTALFCDRFARTRT